MNRTEITKRISLIERKISLFFSERDQLYGQLEKMDNLAYIKKHGITLDQVHLSSVGDFIHIREFAMWLNDVKEWRPYAEWGGRIFRSDDVIQNAFNPTPAKLCDLEEMEATK